MNNVIIGLFTIAFISGCSTIPSTPEPHPEKYAVQIIEMESLKKKSVGEWNRVEGAAPAPELPGRVGPGGEARDWGGRPPRWVATRAREALAAATELWEEDGEGSMEFDVNPGFSPPLRELAFRCLPLAVAFHGIRKFVESNEKDKIFMLLL